MSYQKSLCIFLLCLLGSIDMALAQDTIRIHGSNTLGDRMVPILVEGWMKKFGYDKFEISPAKNGVIKIASKRDGEAVMVEINGKGSSAGFQDLVDGQAEIAMLSRVLTAREIDGGWQLGTLNSPDQEHVIALQAIVAVVHPDNKISGLEPVQLAKILSGEITDWQQLGGKPGAIHVHAARRGTGLAEMQTAVLNIKSAGRTATLHGNSSAIRAAVSADTNAIGVAEFTTRPGKLRALPMRVGNRMIPADQLHVMAEDYPLTRRLYFYTGQIITALGRGFLTYAESEEGQRLLASHGYLSLAPMLFSDAGKKDFPEEYARWVDGASRLSFTFRFGTAFSIFDSRSAQDLTRFKDFIRRPENKNRKVILVGHAEKQSSTYMANSVSNEYADLVATSLVEIGINPMRVRGVGYSLPLTLANNAVYRNRRVEIWLR